LICALAQKACPDGFSVLYRRVPRLLHELQVARADGSFPRVLARWAKTDVLILDDWGLAPLGAPERHDLLEVIEDRHGERSTVIAAQLPVKDWHKYIGDPAVADATLDRVVHAAHQITLKGESMRKKRSSYAPAAVRLCSDQVFGINRNERSASFGRSVRLRRNVQIEPRVLFERLFLSRT
jgi:DNA replication protein DnaC